MDLRDYLVRTSVAQIEYGRSATVDEDATVRHAIGVMQEKKVGCLLATKGGILRGILTERDLIRKALDLTGGNRTKAAKILEISRPVLIAKIKQYGL